ncbi:hypothetical protein CFP56_011344 [Quercus suber]|uniref:Thioesterase domain-containing protein n=1 Tax=Quercus suber TaxID=58331 RepID=A0AAW0MEQ8_QUESU
MEKPTATPRPKAEATSSDSSKTVANNVSAKRISTITGFFQNVGVSDTNSLPDYCNNKYFYSNIIRHALKPDQVLRGRLTCILTVTPALGNFYGSLHGGSLAAICGEGGRNLTVVAMEFKIKKTGQLAYTARAIFYNIPLPRYEVVTPSPGGEAEEATSKSTIIVGKVKDICGEHACMHTNFLRIVGVSNSDFIPHNCKSKDFYSQLIRHGIKPDQLLRGQITMEFKLKKTGKLAYRPYTARTTFYNMPSAKLYLT